MSKINTSSTKKEVKTDKPTVGRSTSAGKRLGTPSNGKKIPSDSLESKIKESNLLAERLTAERDKDREERNLFQQERDKISLFWEITKDELESIKAELRNKDREIEELTEKHQVEIKVYKQKVKHLQYEHQNNITLLKTEEETTLKNQTDEHRGKESAMRKATKKTKVEMKELETSHEDIVKNLKLENDKAITKLRQECERSLKESQSKYEKQTRILRVELDLKRKNELHEVEERKNAHIGELIKKHDTAFTEMKNYYNDITANNLELIKSLKEQLEEKTKKEQADMKIMLEISSENKRLSAPLQLAQKEVEELRRQLTLYNKDKESLLNSKARIKVCKDELKTLKWEHEILEQRFIKVEAERDELYKKFVNSIHQVQQKSDLKNLMLEKKLETLQGDLEWKEAQLSQVISSVNMDPQTVDNLTSRLDSILDEKNQSIKDLHYELSRAKKANNDIIRVYEAKMSEFGIPSEELGFVPHLGDSTRNTTPANLVT